MWSYVWSIMLGYLRCCSSTRPQMCERASSLDQLCRKRGVGACSSSSSSSAFLRATASAASLAAR